MNYAGNLQCNAWWWGFFQRPLTVPLHIPNGRQMPAVRAVQGKLLMGLRWSWSWILGTCGGRLRAIGAGADPSLSRSITVLVRLQPQLSARIPPATGPGGQSASPEGSRYSVHISKARTRGPIDDFYRLAWPVSGPRSLIFPLWPRPGRSGTNSARPGNGFSRTPRRVPQPTSPHLAE